MIIIIGKFDLCLICSYHKIKMILSLCLSIFNKSTDQYEKIMRYTNIDWYIDWLKRRRELSQKILIVYLIQFEITNQFFVLKYLKFIFFY